MNLFISTATIHDAIKVAQLSGQLGYPVTESEIENRLQALQKHSDQIVFVCRTTATSSVVGWIHAYEHHSLVSGPRCEIGALVVDEIARGRGVGSALMEHAESWAKQRSLTHVRFASRVTREDAHRLYARLGYTIQKTSHIFEKKLTAD